jgi:hypothetical protein
MEQLLWSPLEPVGVFLLVQFRFRKMKGKEEGSRSKWAGRWAFFFSFGFLLFW